MPGDSGRLVGNTEIMTTTRAGALSLAPMYRDQKIKTPDGDIESIQDYAADGVEIVDGACFADFLAEFALRTTNIFPPRMSVNPSVTT